MMPDVHRKELWLGILGIILCGVAAGVVFPLTAVLAGLQDGDGMLTALISTQKLTWYFWGQDRLLNVLPALASAFTDVETNLRLQVALRAFFGYLAPIGVLIFFTRQPRFLIVAMAISNIILLSCLSPYGLFNLYVQHNMAGLSLVLLAVMYALTYSRLPVAVVAIAIVLLGSVAYAANFALLTYALPIIVLLGALRQGERKRYALFLGLNLCAIGIAKLHSGYFGEPSTSYGLWISLDGLVASVKTLREEVLFSLFALFGLIAAWFYRSVSGQRLLELAAVVCIALGLIVLLANTLWLKMNAYNIRYFLTSLILLSAVIAYLLTHALMTRKISSGLLSIGCAVGVALCIFLALGGFNAGYKQLVSSLWREQSAAVAKVAVEQKTRIIIGDFWDVWASVYQTRREQDLLASTERMTLYGGAFRSEILRNQFLHTVLGKGEQNALCFFDRAEQCIQELVGRFRLSPEYSIVLKQQAPIQILDKPMLKLVFEVNRAL